MAVTGTRLEPAADSGLASAALRFARRVHLGQHRKQTYEQYIEHPIAVARLLADIGCDGPVLAAAYLHDVVEKTDVELEELRKRFGPEVAALVDALSDDPEISDYRERKQDLRARVLAAGGDSARIFAADRLANMRDWRTIPPGERAECAARLGTDLRSRLRLWVEDADALAEYDSGLPFLAEIEAELRALRAEAEDQVLGG